MLWGISLALNQVWWGITVALDRIILGARGARYNSISASHSCPNNLATVSERINDIPEGGISHPNLRLHAIQLWAEMQKNLTQMQM